jgi:tetratricopeptide (TPR) repeat protein
MLRAHPELADGATALALKDICYAAWTTEPTTARAAAAALKSLARINDSDGIAALSEWVAGIASLTTGKLESAVEHLDRAAQIFFRINRELDAGQTQVAKLYPLALLGRYDEAVGAGTRALRIFEKHKDQRAAGKIEMNLGNIASRRELHREAEKYYRSAHRRFTKLNETTWLTMCENGLAMTYAALNDFCRAEEFYSRALRRARSEKMLMTVAELEASMGNLALFRGRLDEALRRLESSRRLYVELNMPHQMAVAELEIADIYAELNLQQEAFEIYARIVPNLGSLKMQGEEARAHAGFGRAATARGKHKIAAREFKRAARLYVSEKNLVGAGVVKLNQAALHLSDGHFRSALTLARESEKLLNGVVRHRLAAVWTAGEALRRLKNFGEASNVLKKSLAAARKYEQPALAQNALVSLGKLAAEQKHFVSAERHFLEAIEMTETLRAPIAAEEFRMAFLANNLSAYESLAEIYVGQNRIEEAFLLVEKSRSRSLSEVLLSTNTAPLKAPARLRREIERLREELNWFYSSINRRGSESEIKSLQKEAATREKKIATVTRQIESTRTGREDRPSEIDLDKLKKRLGTAKALVEYVNFSGTISAFVVRDDGVEYFPALALESETVALVEGLHFQFGALRYGAENLVHLMPELKKRADAYLEKAYDKIIAPLAKAIENRSLIAVPTGALHYLPFNALRCSARYLIETRQITSVPSAAIWQTLDSRPLRPLKSALLFGAPDENIPLVNAEIAAIGKILKGSVSFTNAAATFDAFRENAPFFDILHLACHGQFRPDNPLFSSLHLADGSVTVRDIGDQKLRAGLVTLSACETGINRIFAGDEILGLARGFLSAGASNLILSLWTVSDAATTKLMKDFYDHLRRGASIAASLRQTQCNSINENLHPYYWSPFTLIGSS